MEHPFIAPTLLLLLQNPISENGAPAPLPEKNLEAIFRPPPSSLYTYNQLPGPADSIFQICFWSACPSSSCHNCHKTYSPMHCPNDLPKLQIVALHCLQRRFLETISNAFIFRHLNMWSHGVVHQSRRRYGSGMDQFQLKTSKPKTFKTAVPVQ